MSSASSGETGAQALADIVRREWPRVVATLVRITGDLSIAEDAAQDAAEQALRAWEDNLPSSPTAWIVAVARRRAIDQIRREVTGRRKTELLARLEAWDQPFIQASPENITGLDTTLLDDQLRLTFGCCHPALSIEAQTALTLRSVGGLTTSEIARAFLVSESTMAQRIVRAKRKIATAAIPFMLPADAELLGRIAAVHRVIYLIFNEGYASSSGDAFVRTDLCNEAIRLGRLLAELMPDDAESLALLSLMLTTHARAPARIDDSGVPVLLDSQDRSRWDSDAIAEAGTVLDRSLRLQRGGALQVQAAISMLHCEAVTAEETDWRQIELLYDRLVDLDPTPVVKLNQAVAVAMHRGTAAGLALLHEPELTNDLDDYPYYHAARADLLARAGHQADAIQAYSRAIALTTHQAEIMLLTTKRDAVGTD